MMKHLFFLLVVAGTLISCGETAPDNDLRPQKMSVEQYTPAALGVLADGTIQYGPNAIATHWKWFFENTNVSDRMVIGSVPVGKKGEYAYEISRFETADDQAFAQVIVWDNQGAEPLRALQFVAPYGKMLPDADVIFAARARWMEYCNAHEVERLIQEMYTPNTLYYNHRPLLRGRAALEKEYAYMKNPDYQLTLTPLHVVPVAEHLVVELGQCSGSYGGKYLIVWQEQVPGTWQVLLDANL
jgi:ketosteroid isomerase-like protein